MRCFRSAGSAAWLVCLAVSCGGDDASNGGGGAGGSGGSSEDAGAGGIDAGAPPSDDRQPPEFAGANSVEVLTDRQVKVAWDPASDDRTDPAAIAYRVYRASSSGDQDYSRALRCGEQEEVATEPCYKVAPSGASSVTFTDIAPEVEFFFVARAVDAAGNEDNNSAELSAQTSDGTAPDFGGVSRATVLSATSIEVTWDNGYDNPTPASELIYNVYVGVGAKPDPTTDDPAYTSEAGELSTTLTGLDPLTTYWIIVRVADPRGNEDVNERYVSVRTPEGISPTFAGAKRASANGTTITVSWAWATDNATEQLNIVYDVWESFTSRGQNLDGPPSYTSDPGRSTIVLPDKETGTSYYYVVRARDVAGNRDANIREVSTTTGGLVDSIPPTFNGVSTVTSATPGTLQASWGAATDNNVKSDSYPGDGVIMFDVYVSATSPVSLTTPFASTNLSSLTLTGLPEGAQRYVVVRARDEAGNVDGNTKEVSGTTMALAGAPNPADTTAPTWGSGPTVATVAGQYGGRLSVSWTDASDDTYAAADLRYHLCVEEIEADCLGSEFASHVRMTSAFGATQATVTGLTARTTYFVVVRAEDKSGNLEGTGHSAQQVTSTSWSDQVKPLLQARCYACHSGADRLTTAAQDKVNYTDFQELVGPYSSQIDDAACLERRDGIPLPYDPVNGCYIKLVDPGHPEHSLIYRKINPIDLQTSPFSPTVPNVYLGSREPRDTSTTLTAEEDSIIRDWIEQGAVSD